MTKRANILYLLWWHLNQYLWFKIPGIACFKAEARSSHVNHLEGQIYPGHLIIEIATEEDTDPFEMLDHLESDFGYARDEMREQLRALQLAASAQLEKQGHFQLIPFGDLSFEKGTLVFKQSQLNIHREFYGTNPLPAQAVQKTYQPEPVLLTPPAYLELRKKKKSLNPLFVILGLLWIIFLALLFWPDKNPTKAISIPLVEDSTELLTAEDSAVLKSVLHHRDDSIISSNEDSTHVLADPDSQETNITPAVIDSLSQLVKYKSCIIIVGSFLNKSNADRLAQKIENLNYQLYRGVYGKFNRVGIQFDCKEKDLQQLMNELKQHFKEGAWVLKMDK